MQQHKLFIWTGVPRLLTFCSLAVTNISHFSVIADTSKTKGRLKLSNVVGFYGKLCHNSWVDRADFFGKGLPFARAILYQNRSRSPKLAYFSLQTYQKVRALVTFSASLSSCNCIQQQLQPSKLMTRLSQRSMMSPGRAYVKKMLSDL